MVLERSPEKKIHIFDSESASAGETLIALMLRDRIDGGHSFEDIVAEMTAFIARMKTRFVLEDLSNLVKNGRISKVAGLLGGMLSLRPSRATTATAASRPSKRCAAPRTPCAVWWSSSPKARGRPQPPA